MGILSDIQAISTASTKLAVDQATLAQLQVQVAAATDAITGDTTASGQADARLSADLQAGGPVYTPNDGGSVSVYQFSANPPGYTITKAVPAADSPPPEPNPTPAPDQPVGP